MSTADVVAELRKQAEVARTIEHPRQMARVLDQRADQLQAEAARPLLPPIDCPSCTTSAEVCEGVSGCCEACAETGRLTMHAEPLTH